MKPRGMLIVTLSVLGPAGLLAQSEAPRLPAGASPAPASSVQAPADPGYAAFIAMCKTPPAAGGARGGGGGGARAGGPPPRQGPREYTVMAIPGVIAAGRKWTFLCRQARNNVEGI